MLIGMVNGVFRIPYSYDNNEFMCVFIVCWVLCFANWLVFVRMTRFRGLIDAVEKKNTNDDDSKEGQQHHRLAKLWTIVSDFNDRKNEKNNSKILRIF